ncbi:MAG: polyphosphate polymerase domain-containing protein [Gammaproteobacteria bacterium]
MRVPEIARQEIKFVANRRDYDLILQWVKLHGLGFSVAYPERTVNNVYFDTIDYVAYAENLAGISSRTKVRYRWYGTSDSPAPGRLEIKRKRNMFGWKLNFDCQEAPCKEGDTWEDVKRSIITQSSPDAGVWLGQFPFPVMINRYRRHYYLSACGRIRITLDFDQQVWDQRYSSQPCRLRPANLPETFVFECKFDRSERDLAERILLGLPIRVSRHSKYMNAVNAIMLST